MIRTETAAVNASSVVPPATSQPASVSNERMITAGTKIADTLSASRWTGAFPDCAASTRARDPGKRGIGPDARRANDEPAEVVEGRSGYLAAGLHLDRDRLTCEHRAVDRRLSLDDDAVGRDLLARANDEHVADLELAHRDELLAAVDGRREHPSRRARAAPGSPATHGPWHAPRGSGRAGSASSRRRRPRSRCPPRCRPRGRRSTRSRPRGCRARSGCPWWRARGAHCARRARWNPSPP